MKIIILIGFLFVFINCFANVRSINLYKNCNRNAIQIAIESYALGDSAPYDFTGAYPYFTDNITLTVTDHYRHTGIDAVKYA